MELFAKIAWYPQGKYYSDASIKDIARYMMVKEAEEKGILTSGKELIEATSGNFGISLGKHAIPMGYAVNVIVSEKVNEEKKRRLEKTGAKVEYVSDDLCPRIGSSYGTDHAIALVRAMIKSYPKLVYLNQHENMSNARGHYEITGPEIWQQTKGKITHFITGVGTGGTIVGAGTYLKEKNPEIKVIAVTPSDKEHHVYGLRNFDVSLKPKVLEEGIKKAKDEGIELIDEWVGVSDEDAFNMIRSLVLKENLYVGPSSAATMHVGTQLAKREEGMVVIIFADSGDDYKDMYAEQGIFTREELINLSGKINPLERLIYKLS